MEAARRCIDGGCPADRRKMTPDARARNGTLERECSRPGHSTRRVTTIVTFALWMSLAACGQKGPSGPASGDAHRGRLLLHQYGCGTCHTIPGVARAHGTVGPPLDDVRRRVYLAGMLPNTPDTMARWIQQPQTLKPRVAMPDMRVPQDHARDMVAYLYDLP
jgi:cytochrome c